jgi:hypothetical protein
VSAIKFGFSGNQVVFEVCGQRDALRAVAETGINACTTAAGCSALWQLEYLDFGRISGTGDRYSLFDPRGESGDQELGKETVEELLRADASQLGVLGKSRGVARVSGRAWEAFMFGL